MARLRSLLALGLVLFGATFGALALSGYYNVRPALNAEPEPGQRSLFVRAQPRQRFLGAAVAENRPTVAAATSAKTKPAIQAVKAPEPKPKAKDKRPQQAAAQWPWNLFSN